MNRAHDKTQYIYEDVRNCIREGLSIKETADLCGCGIETVAQYTKDLRDVKHRAKPCSAELQSKIFGELMDGIPPKEIAKKYDIKIATVYGIKKRWKHDMIVQRDPDAETPPKYSAPETPQDHSDPEPAPTADEENCVCEIVTRPAKGIEMFRNFTANFDGKYARYSIRDNKSVRVMVGNSYCEIKLDDIKGIAGELNEISKIFA